MRGTRRTPWFFGTPSARYSHSLSRSQAEARRTPAYVRRALKLRCAPRSLARLHSAPATHRFSSRDTRRSNCSRPRKPCTDARGCQRVSVPYPYALLPARSRHYQRTTRQGVVSFGGLPHTIGRRAAAERYRLFSWHTGWHLDWAYLCGSTSCL